MRWKRLGLIAGAGALPLRLAAATRPAPFVIRLAAIADEAAKEFPGVECGLGEVGKIIRSLKDAGCDAVVMAGVVKRPDFAALALDWRGVALLPRVVAAAAKGDGALLSVLVDTLEAEGFLVVGADEIGRELAVGRGALGAVEPCAEDFSDMRKAAEVVGALGPFDVGQGAVVAAGLVLAIEAAEGTDAMLERCAALPEGVRGGARRGVLLKMPKPGQELRVDLPTIGVETVRRASAAGLAGVAICAGAALMIDAEAAIRAADEAGIFIYGFDPAELR